MKKEYVNLKNLLKYEMALCKVHPRFGSATSTGVCGDKKNDGQCNHCQLQFGKVDRKVSEAFRKPDIS